MEYNITELLEKIRATVESHRLGEGSYTRWIPLSPGDSRVPAINAYGCADAANILYTLNCFPRDPKERDAFVRNIGAMQNDDGLINEGTHLPIHTTAHCAAALELFEAYLPKPCYAMLPYLDKDALSDYLYQAEGHRGAGIYVALNLTGCADPAWNRAYFSWFWEHTDEKTGFWKRHFGSGEEPLWQYIGDGFHFLFNMEYERVPLRYPERMIDTCLAMYDDKKQWPERFGEIAHYIEMDWIYCLSRASRQTPHRFYEIRERLESFTDMYISNIQNMDFSTDPGVNDLHMLFGMTCALAELQNVLRGTLHSDKPLRLPLDRRPFI